MGVWEEEERRELRQCINLKYEPVSFSKLLAINPEITNNFYYINFDTLSLPEYQVHPFAYIKMFCG